MKKRFLYLIILLALGCIYSFADDNAFTNALRNCTPYTDSGSFQTGGMNVQSTKHILGYQGDKCAYVEKINMMGVNSNISCKFSKPQINEITAVMDAFNLTQKYSDSTPDLSDIDAAQNNPVSKVWSKYVLDGSTCTVTVE